MFTHANREEI